MGVSQKGVLKSLISDFKMSGGSVGKAVKGGAALGGATVLVQVAPQDRQYNKLLLPIAISIFLYIKQTVINQVPLNYS